MQRLLGPGGCPWDREQSLRDLKRFAVEEAFEVCDAVDGLGPDADRTVQAIAPTAHGPDAPEVLHHREELGDLLLQVVFQSELGSAAGWFDIDEVVGDICAKLERRHPHVFGDMVVSGASEVVANWERAKLEEKRGRGALEGVPRSMPSLMQALRMGEKASRVGFDWPDAAGPRVRVDEELAEFDQASAELDREAMQRELGDVLFTVVNLARKLDLDPEEALAEANRRFADRFARVETKARTTGAALADHSPEQLEAWWSEAKAEAAKHRG